MGINIESISVIRGFKGRGIFFSSWGLYRESGGLRTGFLKERIMLWLEFSSREGREENLVKREFLGSVFFCIEHIKN